jgi:hypothetical protein
MDAEYRPEIAIFPVKFPFAGNLAGDRCDLHCVASQVSADKIRSLLKLSDFHSERAVN